MSNPKLIVMWGNPCSGKTTATIKLAQALAALQKNVLVMFSDALCPSIASLFPQQTNQQQSLGELLSLPTLTQEDLLRYTLTLHKQPYLAFLGYKKGDHSFSYASYSREQALDLLMLAKHSADVVLVDCTSYVSSDILSTAALELADHIFRFHTCDLKSLMFYASYLPLLSDARFQHAETIPILSNVKPEHDSRTYNQVVGGVQLQLPHVAALEQQMLEARLLDSLPVEKNSADYQRGIEQMVEIIGMEPPKKSNPQQDQTKKSHAIVRWFQHYMKRGDRA